MPWKTKAWNRVNDTPELYRHRSTIMADWQEGDEHWEWVATAPVTEIVNWAEVVEKD